jgi:hypothetical protein
MRSLVPIALLILIGAICLSACGSSENSPGDNSLVSSARQSRPPSRAGDQPRIVATSRRRPEVEPGRLEFTGLEGHPFALARISWATWGGDKATGNATLQAVKCDPECAYGEYEDRFTVHVVLRRLDSKCGELLYRKVFVFHAGEGQYFPINCPANAGGRRPGVERSTRSEAVGARRVNALLKKDFGVSGHCVRKGHPRTYECYADGSNVGRMRLHVGVARSGDSVTITHCEPAVKLQSNEVAFCALRRLRG